MTNKDIKSNDLKASINSIDWSDDNIEIIVRLSNSATTALHYISDVRATKYDPDTKTLIVSLSDEGRELIPGIIGKLPVFRYIDPESDAEIRLKVPDRLIKLSRTAPPGELAFETYQLSDAEKISLDVAWADVPYYKDTRPTDDMRLPAARWQQHKATLTKSLNGRRKSRR
jgi:hypothetical protein